MADVMEERVRSIELCAGVAFTLGALILSMSLVLYPKLAPANQTNLIIEALTKEDIGSWMGLHAFMVLGFLLSTLAFVAFGFLLHLKGSSGAASLVTTSAVIGGAVWSTFLSMEFFVAPFIKNLYPVDPGLATMIFSTLWFWKMGALTIGGLLLFTAVLAAGTAATSRGILPLWLGWGGAFFAGVGILVYVFEFWTATATGTAINPLRGGGVRYGVGLPLQLWMIGVGAMLLRDYRSHAQALPPQARTHVPPKRDMPPGPKRDTPPGQRRDASPGQTREVTKKGEYTIPDFPEAPPLPPPIP